MNDAFTSYETGLTQLLKLMGQDHPRYIEVLTFQSRMAHSIAQARKYGDTAESRAEQTRIVEALNQLALQTVKKSFNELCGLVHDEPMPPIPTPPGPILPQPIAPVLQPRSSLPNGREGGVHVRIGSRIASIRIWYRRLRGAQQAVIVVALIVLLGSFCVLLRTLGAPAMGELARKLLAGPTEVAMPTPAPTATPTSMYTPSPMPTFSPTPSITPTPTRTATPTSTSTPTPIAISTPTPTRTFTLTPTDTPVPTSVVICAPPPSSGCTPSGGDVEPSVCVAGVSVQINEGTSRPVVREEHITLKAGDTLRLVCLHYCASCEALAHSVAGEAYLLQNGVEHGDGLFIPEGPHIRAGCDDVGNFEGSWTMEAGQYRVAIALLHYFDNNYEVDAHFHFNLDVIEP